MGKLTRQSSISRQTVCRLLFSCKRRGCRVDKLDLDGLKVEEELKRTKNFGLSGLAPASS
jgi:hypothetical protein